MKHIGITGSMTKTLTAHSFGGTEVWTANFINEIIKRDCLCDLYALKGSLNRPPKIQLQEIWDSH